MTIAVVVGCDTSAPPTPRTADQVLQEAALRNRPQGRANWPDPPASGAPVAVRFEQLVDGPATRQARLHFYNYADRDVVGIELDLRYVDEAGRVLKHLPWRARPELPAGGVATRLVGAFLPAQTQRVDATVVAVHFADGSRWPPATESVGTGSVRAGPPGRSTQTTAR